MGEAKYWKGLDELKKTKGFVEQSGKEFAEELPTGNNLDNAKSSRRDFLKFLGFSVGAATLAASCEMPVRKSIPYLVKPDDITPGIPNFYASTFYERGAYNSVMVKTREGRPIKIEGNPLSEISYGGTDAAAQGSVLSLYDNTRPKGPSAGGNKTTWAELDKVVVNELEQINASGGNIRILSSTIISPSLKAAIADFKAKYPTTEHVTYDAISYSGILNANEQSFGQRVIPAYDFEKADVVVGLGADFLGTWVSPTEFSVQHSRRRKVSKDNNNMNRHIQVESYMSITGSNADKRVVVKPSQEGVFALNLYNQVASKTGGSSLSGVPSLDGGLGDEAAKIAAELVAARGKSLVVSGSNDVNVQLVVNGINTLLGNYGATISFDNYYNLRQGDDKAVDQLVKDMKAGNVAAVLFVDTNPVYSYPDAEGFADALGKVKLTVSLNDKIDESSVKCVYHAPDCHYLEAWGDAEPKNGQFSLIQPAIDKLFDTRQSGESLLKWAGINTSYYDYVRNYWETNIYSKQSKYLSFNTLWDRSVHDGLFNLATSAVPATFTADLSATVSAIKAAANSNGIEVVFYEKAAIGDGKRSDNPWLQEMPDPVSKVTWDNYACVSFKFAEEQGWDLATLTQIDSTGERKGGKGFYTNVVKVTVGGKSVNVPVIVMPGTAYNTLAIAYGYGRTVAGKAAEGAGVNIYPLVQTVNGTLANSVGGAQVETTSDEYLIAQTQTHGSINDGLNERPIVKETVLSEYKKNPAAGNEDREKVLHHMQTLYGYHDYDGLKWGMAVDLNTCFGCGACVVACNAENNIPVVGKEEVSRSREMHWLRIDRYFSGDVENPSVIFQPMMCQHCDNAPCENVCPVSATNHSTEGLNQMAYNRCIGTRYCANNCPYKVRRFNWFDYLGADSFKGWAENNHDPYEMTNDLTRMVLNPDVTVRSRGVMEKCSFCVQRLQYGKLEAKKAGRPLEDSDIQVACQAACATGAITFGNVNNDKSEVFKNTTDPRAFKVIEEIHTLPSVAYLTKVRNKEASEA